MNLEFNAKEARILAGGYKLIEVIAEGVTLSEVLDQVKIEDVIRHYDDWNILDKIGIDRVKDYFDLTEITED